MNHESDRINPIRGNQILLTESRFVVVQVPGENDGGPLKHGLAEMTSSMWPNSMYGFRH